MTTEDDRTPIERPLMRSDLNEIREIVHSIQTIQIAWYKESKELAGRISRLERRVWLPAVVSIAAAALAVLARVVP